MTVDEKVLNKVKSFLNGEVNDQYSDPVTQIFAQMVLGLIEEEEEKATEELINSFTNPTP